MISSDEADPKAPESLKPIYVVLMVWSHTMAAYSMIDRMRDRYAFRRQTIGQFLRLYQRKTMMEQDFLEMLQICALHVRSLENLIIIIQARFCVTDFRTVLFKI